MAFEWSQEKAEYNLKEHGISFEEAATVFDDPFAEFLLDVAPSFEENRYLCLGSSKQGTLLLISFTERGDDVRIISARDDTERKKSL